MKTTTMICSILLIQGAAFGQTVRPLPAPIRWDDAFDGRAPVDFRSLPAPEVPAVGRASAANGFTGLAACRVLDAAYFRQPSRAEAVSMLASCLRAFGDRFGGDVSASSGSDGIVLTVSGGQVAEELKNALALRGDSLLGHPTQVRESQTLALEGAMSSLQPVIDHCPAGSAVQTPSDFVTAYADCLRRAKGLSIVRVLEHPARPDTILVYTEGADAEQEMSGVVRLGAGEARLTLRIEARRQSALASGR